LNVAESEAKKFLNADQYAHVLEQFDQLAFERNPRLSKTQDVRPIEEYYELRDKGGLLGRINLRVYFAVFDDRSVILVLGCYNKRDEDQTPQHIKIKMRNRLRVGRKLLGAEN
jgi:hypothetical protein